MVLGRTRGGSTRFTVRYHLITFPVPLVQMTARVLLAPVSRVRRNDSHKVTLSTIDQ